VLSREMITMSDADAAAMLKAIIDERPYPGGLADAPANRRLWDGTAAEAEDNDPPGGDRGHTLRLLRRPGGLIYAR
jgi:hypothetical protein